MILSLLSGVVAFATTPLAAAPDPAFHDETPQNIVITAPFARSSESALSGVTVLSGAELVRQIRPTIGETLARTPGVSATSFGPNASRPVLRGFQGERVRVLTDGIGSFDVSNTSVDHAVAINPLTADRIEVLRGPSALLYGSSAIGGVVNVIDSRIPRRVPDEPIHVDALASYGSAANERSGSAAIEAPLAGKIVFHLDGSYLKTGDLEIGGAVLSPALQRQAAASPDADIRALADLKRRLPNSAAETWEVAGGVAIITETGNFGVSVSHYDNFYGVPVRYALDPAIEAENVRLKMQQTRQDMRAEVETGGTVLETIRFRAGHADYRHAEIEDSGEVGTRFFNDSYEARLELVQKQRGGWRGAIGGQMLIRNFDVVGEEAFLPRNETQQYGVFTLQEYDAGPFKAEAGARYEHSILSAVANAGLGNPDLNRRFDAFSGSLGASIAVADGIRLGLNGSHTERAPSAEELFANGPHAGTQSFEIGNPDFTKETSWGIEATARARFDRFTLAASAYHSWFDDYIYETQTGAVQDDLPVFRYNQAAARYYGFEIEAAATLARFGGYDLAVDGSADYVHARIVGAGPAPRIPPLRVLGGVALRSPRVTGRVEAEWSDRQNRTQPFETATDSFTVVNAAVTLQPFATNRTTLVLSANNLFDVVARRHASFLKDYAPLAGRDLRATVRFTL